MITRYHNFIDNHRASKLCNIDKNTLLLFHAHYDSKITKATDPKFIAQWQALIKSQGSNHPVCLVRFC